MTLQASNYPTIHPTLDLQFAATRTLSTLITFTRSSSGTFFGSDSQLKTAGTDVPRFDHNPSTGESLGLLIEEQRTNSIRNNTMVGAVAGTPGTLPTSWAYVSVGSGLTREVVGTGVESGINYIDLRISGTATSTTVGVIAIDRGSAATGQTWTESVYLKLAAGSVNGITSWNILITEETSTNVYLAGADYPIAAPTSTLTRASATRTLSGGATVALVFGQIRIFCTNGAAIDFTLRIGMPQLEQGAFATSVIPTSGAAATRNADVASISGSNFSSWYRQDEGTVFAETQFPAGTTVNTSSRSVFDATDGSTNNRVNIRAIGGSITADQFTIRSGASNVAQFSSNGTAVSTTSRKLAVIYKVDDFASWATGATSAATDISGAVPVGINQSTIGSTFGATEYLSGTIRRLTYWPVRLSNNVLQELTR